MTVVEVWQTETHGVIVSISRGYRIRGYRHVTPSSLERLKKVLTKGRGQYRPWAGPGVGFAWVGWIGGD